MTMWEWKAHRTLHDIEWCIQLGNQEMRDFTCDVRLIRAFCLSLSSVSYYMTLLYIWVSVLAFIKIKLNFISSMIAGNNEETPKKLPIHEFLFYFHFYFLLIRSSSVYGEELFWIWYLFYLRLFSPIFESIQFQA